LLFVYHAETETFTMGILDLLYYAFLYIIGLLVLFKVLAFLFTVTVAYVVARRNPRQPLDSKNS
jgi:hypothetical protein